MIGFGDQAEKCQDPRRQKLCEGKTLPEKIRAPTKLWGEQVIYVQEWIQEKSDFSDNASAEGEWFWGGRGGHVPREIFKFNITPLNAISWIFKST